MYGLPMPDCHALVSYFSFFFFLQIFIISRVFGLQLGNLAALLIDMLFLGIGFISLVDEIQFILIGNRHICIRL